MSGMVVFTNAYSNNGKPVGSLRILFSTALATVQCYIHFTNLNQAKDKIQAFLIISRPTQTDAVFNHQVQTHD